MFYLVEDLLIWVIILILILCSSFFSSSETALSSCNRFRLKKIAVDGNKKAKMALKVHQQYDRVLTCILISNTILNILISTIGTVVFTKYFGAMGAGISTVFFTVVLLTFAEIIPKTFANAKAEAMCIKNARAIYCFMIFLKPLIVIFDAIRDFAGKIVKIDRQPVITEQELKFMVEEIKDQGILEDREGELVRSALDLDEMTACEAMTPRVDLIAVELNESFEKIKSIFLMERYSRLPVYDGNIDNIVGILSEKDFFRSYLSEKKFSLNDIIKKALLIPPQMNISDLMKKFQKGKIHMAIVVDQYGGVEGVVTFEDIIEQLIGEIHDEKSSDESRISSIGENKWRVSSDVGVCDMFRIISSKEFEKESSTVGGWVLKNLEKLPKINDSFIFEDLEITVSKMKNKRIIEVVVKKINFKD